MKGRPRFGAALSSVGRSYRVDVDDVGIEALARHLVFGAPVARADTRLGGLGGFGLDLDAYGVVAGQVETGKEIVLSARAAGDRAIIDVKDGGIGIEKGDQSRIFFAFERVASVHRVGGLGLGLFIGRQIVEAHGGTLLVTSQPGQGSTFTLELPREALATAGPPADRG